MRWPFSFGRGSAAKGSRGPEPQPPLRDWASLPATQLAVGELQLTAPTAAFVQSLAGAHDPDLSLERLGHHVSLDAPSGLVSGLARTVETYGPSHELVGRPRPPRPLPVQRRIFGFDDPTVATPAAEDAADELEAVPVMISSTVIDEPVQARAPLTRLAEADANAVLRLAMPRPASAPNMVLAPAGGEPAPEIASRPVTAQRLTLGQSRRLGLGAPILKQAGASVQRSVDATPLELAPPTRASHAAEADTAEQPEVHAVEVAVGAQPAPPAFERTAPIAGATIQRGVTLDAGEIETPARLPPARATGIGVVDSAPDSVRAVIQRVVATPLPPLFSRPGPTPTAPLVPDRPPLLSVRRSVDFVEVSAEAVEPVMVQRAAAVSLGEPPAPVLQLDMPPARGPATYRELVTSATPSPRSLPQLAPPAPLVQRATPAVQDFAVHTPFATTTPGPPSAVRTPASIDFPVQREVAAGEAPAAEPSGASAPQATAASTGPTAAAAPGQNDKELDELARKLHDRISMHIRRDLLIQRERAGMMTDLR